MPRTLQVEIDEDYFDRFGSSFFKSFFRYNPKWQLFVVDLGLREDQRKLLAQYGEVKAYPRDRYRRWGQLSARISAWYDVLSNCDVVLHLDVDAVVTDTFEPEFNAFIDGNYDIGGQDGIYTLPKSVRYRKGAEQMLGLEPNSTVFSNNSQLHAGWLLMRNTEHMLAALEWFRDNWEEYQVHTTEEETGLAGIVHARELKLQQINVVDCPVLNIADKGYKVPCLTPPSKFIHFAYSKYYTDQSSAGTTREGYMAWRHVLFEPYAALPWPNPELVCEHK